MWTVSHSPACAKAGHWTTDMDSSHHHEDGDITRHTGVTHHSHSRSQSWSLPGAAPRAQADFAPGITSMYSISPISTVIREFVPSFVQLTRSSDPSNMNSYRRIRRNSSSGTLYGDQERERGTPPQDGGYRRDQWTHGDVSINMEGLDERRPHEQAIRHEHVEQSTLGVEISEGVRWMERNAVFIVILLIKFSYYHRYGLMIILGMFGTFFHCNQVIRRQVALKNQRHKSILILTVLFLASNIFFVYYAFWDKHIYNCLYFRPPQFVIDSTNLLWSIWVTDYIVKFGTMALKALLAALFVRVLPTNKKGRYYMLLEYGSQLYRNIIPAPLWVRYLSNKEPSTGVVFAVVITATYLMIKGVVIFLSVRDLYRAIISLIKYPLYQTVHNREQLSQSGNTTCPICQESYHKPVALSCKHVFCEDCVLQWLDKQNSCPLCRAAVPNHNPKWRDGSTSSWPQLF